jgi:hypothetical protein
MGVIFLRNKVSGAVADAYAIGGASPELVAAFLTAADGTTEGEYFRTGGVEDDFSMFTFSRSGTATYFDSSGVLQTAADGVARRNAYYYNSGWTKGGLRLERNAAIQLLHGTDSFATQTETVTAQAYTLQFRGTGSIALTGAHTATLTGTGANDLVSLTFTPSAGTLTLTPSGTVDYPQLEVGSIPTSYIPNTAGSGTVTRAAETLSIAQANYPTADDATPHWFLIDVRMWDEDTRQDWLDLDNSTTGFRFRQETQKARVIARTPADGQVGVIVLNPSSTAFTQFDLRLAHRFTTSEHGGSANGGPYVSTALTEVPAVPSQDLDLTADEFNGFIREIRAGLGEPATTDLEAASA